MNATNCFNGSDISFRDPFSITSTPTSPSNAYASDVFSCPHCLECSSTSASVTPSSCPKSNGEISMAEGLGIVFPLGVLALRISVVRAKNAPTEQIAHIMVGYF